MDWRPSSSTSTSPAPLPWLSWIRSIMVLIASSARGGSSRQASWQQREKKASQPTTTTTMADGRLRRPVPPVLPLLTVTLLGASAFLLPNVAADVELVRVRDYAILGPGEGAAVCGEPPEGADPDTLNLSELVAQSDVIFKAFAGHGNDLREAVLNRSAVTVAPHRNTHQHQHQQQHHQPRWKADPAADERKDDFVVRLEPAIVYKGNELFQQLQLNSWKRYFIIWSNGSVEYSHRGVPSQGRPSGSSGGVDERTFAPSAPGATVQPSPQWSTVEPYARQNGGGPRGGRILNCTAWWKQRRAGGSPRPIIVVPGSGSPSEQARSGADEERGRAANGNLGELNRIIGRRDAAGSRVKSQPSTASERVNLPDGRTGGPIEANPPENGASPAEGQISYTLNEILPVTVIVFGRRVVAGAGGAEENSLRVDPHVGLLRWDERLEDALWQALGWSKWSDYTGCSVGCGKGVQQRFRHCLLSSGGGGHEQAATSKRPPSSRGAHVPTNSSPTTNGGNTNEAETPPPGLWDDDAVEAPDPPTPLGALERRNAGIRRTQPAAVYPPPGASIRASDEVLQSSPVSEAKGKKKPYRPSTRTAAQREKARDAKDAIKRAPPLAEAGHHLPTPPSDGEPASETHHNRSADHGGTWPSCEGHNIEQRSCNMFDCAGSIDLLTSLPPDNHWRNWNEGFDDRINYEINRLEQNFTLMISLRVRQRQTEGGSLFESDAGRPAAAGGSILSVRSKLTTGPSLSINFITDGHGGLRVIQEKYGLSEMLPVRELALLDGDWHSLALSGRNGGGFVTLYGDCRWINSFMLTKGSIELPQYPTVEVGRDVELRQLTVVPGEKSARLQCHSPAVPIRDVENRQVTNYFEHLN